MSEKFVHFPANTEVEPVEVKLNRRIHYAVELPRIANMELQRRIEPQPCCGILYQMSRGILVR